MDFGWLANATSAGFGDVGSGPSFIEWISAWVCKARLFGGAGL